MRTNRDRYTRPNLECLESRAVPAAFADFNGDGYGDLAIGDPFASDDETSSFGAVHVVYGSARGLDTNATQLWTQESYGIADSSESSDWFGLSLATGDFNGDGFADLAVGVPNESIGVVPKAGAVHVIYGSTEGLTFAGNQLWSQDSEGIGDFAENGDAFGWSMAAGDFNGDGIADLAVGAPREGLPLIATQCGAAHVIYGSPAGLSSANSQVWSQASSGLLGSAENFDRFGSVLAAGDFNGDGEADLAIGVPDEDLNAISDAGAVNVLYGSAVGLTEVGNQLWTQDSPNVKNSAENSDTFGSALATGDFNADGLADLAVGVPRESFGALGGAGAVQVFYGSGIRLANGLSAANSQFWHQNSYGIAGMVEDDDGFGADLATGDFNGDGEDDLAIGVPHETLRLEENCGVVNVIYGSVALLTAANNQLFSQDTPGIPGAPQTWDRFGDSLATGDFNGDGNADLAIGIPRDYLKSQSGESYGAVQVLYGTAGRLSGMNGQFLPPESIGIYDCDSFGWSLAGN